MGWRQDMGRVAYRAMSIEKQHYKWEAAPVPGDRTIISEETISYLLFLFLLELSSSVPGSLLPVPSSLFLIYYLLLL